MAGEAGIGKSRLASDAVNVIWTAVSSGVATALPPVWPWASGGALTVIVNVFVADVSSPPFAVPPLSVSATDTVADPCAPAAAV